MLMMMMVSAQSSSFPVLVMGDWGGKDKHPYTTKGEVATAKGMKHFAEKNEANTTVVLGDNFYDKGVKSVDDSRFKTTFEDVFDKDVLTDFRVLAGNHDHNGNVRLHIEISNQDFEPTFNDHSIDFENRCKLNWTTQM